MKKASMILAVLLVLPLIWGSVGCGSGNNGTSTEVIKVGAVLPLSGYLGTVGKETAAGLRYVATEINAAGGIQEAGGARLEIKVVDDKGDPTITASEVERMITEERVAAVFIGSDEACQALAAPLADKHKVPVISTGSYDSAVMEKGYSYHWAGASSSSYPGMAETYKRFIGRVFSDYGKSPKTVALLTYQATDMLKGRSDILLPEIAARDLTVVFDVQHTFGVSSWDSYALKLKEAKPDMFLAFTDPYSQVDLIKALDRLNYLPPIALWLGLNWQSYIGMMGADIASRTIGQPGQFTTCSMVYNCGYTQALDFRTRYEAVNGTGTYGLAIVGAQAMYLLVRAIGDAGSADPTTINNALAKVNIPEGDPYLVMPNFAPALKFSASNEPVNQGFFIAQWQDDVCHVVNPELYATADAQFE